MTYRAWLAIIVLLVIQAVLLWTPAFPLGIPGEWVWPRISGEMIDPVSILLAILVSAAYYGYIQWGRHKMESRDIRYPFWLLFGMTVLAALNIWMIRSIPQGIYGTAGLSWVTYYPRMSGYFTQAAEHEHDLAAYLKNYEASVRAGDYLHQGTHPPGLPVYYAGWLQACQSIPLLEQFLIWSQPVPVQEGIDILEELAVASGQVFPPRYRAVLWGHTLLTLIGISGTVFPLFWILKQSCSPRLAWSVCSIASFCPGLILFLPKSDVLLPVLGITTAAFFYASLQARPVWKKFLFGLLAGLCLGQSLTISLAMLVVLVMLVGWLVLKTASAQFSESPTLSACRHGSLYWQMLIKSVITASSLFTGILLVMFCWSLVAEVNLLAVWKWNLVQHARFYDFNPRTFTYWLLANPLELVISFGLPAAIFSLLAIPVCLKSRQHPLSLPGLVVSLVWGLLWLSGKNMGEAARLWTFFFPWLLLLTARYLESVSQGDLVRENRAADRLLILQIISAMLVTTAIDAFDYSSFFPNS